MCYYLDAARNYMQSVLGFQDIGDFLHLIMYDTGINSVSTVTPNSLRPTFNMGEIESSMNECQVLEWADACTDPKIEN